MTRVALAWLTERLARVLAAGGATPEDAQIVSAHLVDAEARGVRSHGVLRVPQYLAALRQGTIRPAARLTTVRTHGATAVCDAGHGFGIARAREAMLLALDLARSHGIGCVTVRACGHTGRLGAHTALAAAQGAVGIMLVNGGGAGQWVAPHGGRAGRVATNPLSIATPAAPEAPLVVDLATSAGPEGAVRAALAAGRPVPAGWLIDAQGQPTTDPQALYGPPPGALLPFGGHKGAALAIAVEALAGGLSGAGCCEGPAPAASPGDGVLVLALDVAAVRPLADFALAVARMLAWVRSSPPIGSEPVCTPGQPEQERLLVAQRDGLVLPPEQWQALADAAAAVHIPWEPTREDRP